MARNPEVCDWAGFTTQHPDLLRWREGPLFDFYGTDVLEDRTARFCFVLPMPRKEDRARAAA
jgi:hypothetical protein